MGILNNKKFILIYLKLFNYKNKLYFSLKKKKTLFSPNKSYYDNQNKYLQNDNNKIENYMLKEYDIKTSTNMHKNPNGNLVILYNFI